MIPRFVAFYSMRAVMFVPPDEMADVTIAGLSVVYSYTPIKPHGGLTGQLIPIPYPIYIKKKTKKKNKGFGTRTTQPAAILQIMRKAAVRL